jgi:hypothetical protein
MPSKEPAAEWSAAMDDLLVDLAYCTVIGACIGLLLIVILSGAGQ